MRSATVWGMKRAVAWIAGVGILTLVLVIGLSLLLLTIDTDRLTSPVVEEQVPGAERPFPHVYGPVNVSAVVACTPDPGREPGQ